MSTNGMPLSALLRCPSLGFGQNTMPTISGYTVKDHRCVFLCVNELDQDGRNHIERIDQENSLNYPRAAGGVCVSPVLPSYELELLLPLLKRHGVGVVIFVQDRRLSCAKEILLASTLALAVKLGITMVMLDKASSVTAIAAALHAFLHSDSLRRSANLLSLNERLAAQQELTPELCRQVLSADIHAEIAVVDSLGLVLAGTLNGLALGLLRDAIGASLLNRTDDSMDAVPLYAGPNPRVLAVPVPAVNRRSTTDLWVVAVFPELAADIELTGARELLLLSAVALSGWNARRRIEGDFFTSARGAILTQLATSSHQVSDHLASQALSVGWNLSAWHTVISARVTNRNRSIDFGIHLKAAFEAQGYEVESNRFAEHWLVWESRKSQPNKEEYGRLIEAVERTCGNESSRVVFGISRPRFGPEGFAASLLEAEVFVRQAGTTLGRKAVVDARESSSSQLIRVALADPGLLRLATRYLEGLAEPQNSHLRATLIQYLRCESRLAETARVLRLHRNTVLQRLERIERLFSHPLADPHVKFALRIALQVLDQQNEGERT